MKWLLNLTLHAALSFSTSFHRPRTDMLFIVVIVEDLLAVGNSRLVSLSRWLIELHAWASGLLFKVK